MCKVIEFGEAAELSRHVLVITDRKLCSESLTERIEKLCQLQPAGIVLREKDLPEEDYFVLAEEADKICREAGVPLVLHFFPGVAERLSIRKIHLPLWKLREMEPERKENFDVIGVSVHAPEEAVEAESLGATYLTAGHIFRTDCKKGAEPRGLAFLKKVCESVSIPVYGIGGISLERGQMRAVMDCGARGVCIMSGMMRLKINR